MGGHTVGPREQAADERQREAEAHLRAAQDLHARGHIDAALAEGEAALALAPGYVGALLYLGTTLVARKGDFRRGLAYLERAGRLAPEDAGVFYSLGWCYEFAAHALRRRPPNTPDPDLDPQRLYEKAAAYLRRCLELDPEEDMRGDAEKLLEVITG